mgnify:CR=1 FL=1
MTIDPTDPFQRTDTPLYHVTLWPNRSLGRKGFRNTMILAIIGTTIPMVPLYRAAATPWILLFGIVPVALLFFLFIRNYRDGRLTEEIRIYPNAIAVERREPSGEILRWHANPYWVRIKMQDEPIENYLTLEGNQRTIELGAFLSPEERETLKAEIETVIHKLDINA